MIQLIYYFTECQVITTQFSCILQFAIASIIIIIDFLLLLGLLLIYRKRLKQEGQVKKRIGLVFLVIFIQSVVHLMFDILGLQIIQLQTFLQNLTLSLIFIYFAKKLTKSETQTFFVGPKIKIFYTIILITNILAFGFALFRILTMIFQNSIKIVYLFYCFQELLSVITLTFLALLVILTRNYQTRALKSFKFNSRNFPEFKMHQYVLQNLKIYFLAILVSNFVKFMSNLYLLVKIPENSIYFVPVNFPYRELLNSLIKLLIRILVIFFPVFASQRLFKLAKIIKKKQIPKIFEEDLNNTGFSINDHISQADTITMNPPRKYFSESSEYQKLN